MGISVGVILGVSNDNLNTLLLEEFDWESDCGFCGGIFCSKFSSG